MTHLKRKNKGLIKKKIAHKAISTVVLWAFLFSSIAPADTLPNIAWAHPDALRSVALKEKIDPDADKPPPDEARRRFLKIVGGAALLALLGIGVAELMTPEQKVPAKHKPPIQKPLTEKPKGETDQEFIKRMQQHGAKMKAVNDMVRYLDPDSRARLYAALTEPYIDDYIRRLSPQEKKWVSHYAYQCAYYAGEQAFQLSCLAALGLEHIIGAVAVKINENVDRANATGRYQFTIPKFNPDSLIAAAQDAGVPINLLIAIMFRETEDFRVDAVCPNDGHGLTQVNRTTLGLYWDTLVKKGVVTGQFDYYKRAREILFDPNKNIWAGAVVMADAMRAAREIVPGADYANLCKFALAIYNRGEGATRDAVKLAGKNRANFRDFNAARGHYHFYKKQTVKKVYRNKRGRIIKVRKVKILVEDLDARNMMIDYVAYIYGGLNSQNHPRCGFYRTLEVIAPSAAMSAPRPVLQQINRGSILMGNVLRPQAALEHKRLGILKNLPWYIWGLPSPDELAQCSLPYLLKALDDDSTTWPKEIRVKESNREQIMAMFNVSDIKINTICKTKLDDSGEPLALYIEQDDGKILAVGLKGKIRFLSQDSSLKKTLSAYFTEHKLKDKFPGRDVELVDVIEVIKDVMYTGSGSEEVSQEIYFVKFPGVFSPQSSTVSLHRNTENLNFKHLLDMGCGCGFFSIYFGLRGSKILALDINPLAVWNTRFNADLVGLSETVEARVSDGFEAIKKGEEFDGIINNSPALVETIGPESFFQRVSRKDHKGEWVVRFLRGASKVLTRDGKIYLSYSANSQGLVSQEAVENGLKVEDIKFSGWLGTYMIQHIQIKQETIERNRKIYENI